MKTTLRCTRFLSRLALSFVVLLVTGTASAHFSQYTNDTYSSCRFCATAEQCNSVCKSCPDDCPGPGCSSPDQFTTCKRCESCTFLNNTDMACSKCEKPTDTFGCSGCILGNDKWSVSCEQCNCSAGQIPLKVSNYAALIAHLYVYDASGNSKITRSLTAGFSGTYCVNAGEQVAVGASTGAGMMCNYYDVPSRISPIDITFAAGGTEFNAKLSTKGLSFIASGRRSLPQGCPFYNQ